MTREDADYAIDKALATGLLDSSGGLNFTAKGTRDEIVAQIVERAAAWGCQGHMKRPRKLPMPKFPAAMVIAGLCGARLL